MKRKRAFATKATIKYPTWRNEQSWPTKLETLYVCDKCGYSEWSTGGWPYVRYCRPRGNVSSHGRLREATEKEKQEGLSVLKRRKTL
jgi:hypothetical protein